MNDLRHSDTWQGTHLGLHYKITHHAVSEYNPKGTWCYYIFLVEREMEDFESLWLDPKVIKTTPESGGFVSYDYSSTKPADASWHGGVTYYQKHGEVVGHRSVEFGCDYAHLYDDERDYNVESIKYDCLKTIEELRQMYPQKGQKV